MPEVKKKFGKWVIAAFCPKCKEEIVDCSSIGGALYLSASRSDNRGVCCHCGHHDASHDYGWLKLTTGSKRKVTTGRFLNRSVSWEYIKGEDNE